MVKAPEGYAWSSFRPTLGLAPAPAGLSADWLLGQFGRTKAVARQRYQAFVQAGIGHPSPWKALKGQVLLGSEPFVERETSGRVGFQGSPRPSLDQCIPGAWLHPDRDRA